MSETAKTLDPEMTEGRAASDGYILDDQIGYLMRLAGQRHAAIFLANNKVDLTPTQFAALVRLAEVGECSQNELGRKVAMDIATTKGVVDRLKDKGLVQSRSDPHDKRRALLSLVPGQEEFIAGLHEAGREISAKTLEPLTKAEAERFLKILRKLV
ncbi:MarR family winged helix-turn-helix transcriptional regulator [Roseovarius sp. C7]|uniref:MarR family winged helix-turn-helix transcriptional regulator n=1 Tax=Roseovarius sp. C7 TaxID=3398643 RepID=UPI0039F5A3A4